MTPSLPPRANLEQLRNQAKDVLKAHKRGDPACCAVLRHLLQFKGKADDEIVRASVGLQEVQFALAMHYGFGSWTEMKHAVSAEDSAAGIDGVPKLSWKTNTQCCFVGALAAALAGTDHPVSERELNGLTALAFRTRWLVPPPDSWTLNKG